MGPNRRSVLWHLLLIDEVPVLKGNLFAAVFDFKDLTGVFFLVIDDHVKLAILKLQFETR